MKKQFNFSYKGRLEALSIDFILTFQFMLIVWKQATNCGKRGSKKISSDFFNTQIRLELRGTLSVSSCAFGICGRKSFAQNVDLKMLLTLKMFKNDPQKAISLSQNRDDHLLVILSHNCSIFQMTRSNATLLHLAKMTVDSDKLGYKLHPDRVQC